MKRYLSELIGTFSIVFCGTSAIVINDLTSGIISHAGIAATFGLIVMVMIYAFGEISGAHFNPAVTFAFWCSGRFAGKMVIPYMVAQFTGALLASVAVLLLLPGHETLGATIPRGVIRSFFMEILLAFFLMLVIINVSTGAKETGVMAGIAIGGTVLLEAMFAGPVSGASMNPARSLAPALISGELSGVWIYLTAPFIGSALAIASCIGIKGKECCPTPSAMCK